MPIAERIRHTNLRRRVNASNRCWRSRGFPALAISAVLGATGCNRAEPPAPPPPEVLVTQKDVPIYTEWVGTTVGFCRARSSVSADGEATTGGAVAFPTDGSTHHVHVRLAAAASRSGEEPQTDEQSAND
jgi:hypothetical protein